MGRRLAVGIHRVVAGRRGLFALQEDLLAEFGRIALFEAPLVLVLAVLGGRWRRLAVGIHRVVAGRRRLFTLPEDLFAEVGRIALFEAPLVLVLAILGRRRRRRRRLAVGIVGVLAPRILGIVGIPALTLKEEIFADLGGDAGIDTLRVLVVAVGVGLVRPTALALLTGKFDITAATDEQGSGDEGSEA